MEINKLFLNYKISLLFVLVFSFSHAQKELRGIVYDDITKKPLESVVVYLNGTTRGTVTDAKGRFYFELNTTSNESLIISYLGYQNVVLEQSTIEDKKNIIVYLKEQLELLEPVYVENDDWSREKKMKYFKKHFIGPESIQKHCSIINEDDINLFYSKSKKTLYASAYVPIKIKNDFFGYSISYDLTDFEAKFKFSNAGRLLVNSVFFMGTSFFKELGDNNDTNYTKRREKAYKGSVLHFMRSLATNTLDKNGFEILYKGRNVAPENYFAIENKDGFAKIRVNAKKIGVVHNKSLRSNIVFNSESTNFNIDGFGNYRPVRLFHFSGYMGRLKVGKMLPLDYGLE